MREEDLHRSAFMRAVNSAATVISSGDEESHGHPRSDTLSPTCEQPREGRSGGKRTVSRWDIYELRRVGPLGLRE